MTLTDPHNSNVIKIYGIEKCHFKQLSLGIYSLCMHLYSLHMHGKQSIRRPHLFKYGTRAVLTALEALGNTMNWGSHRLRD